MKIIMTFIYCFGALSALQCQNVEVSLVSISNAEYLEWVADHGFRFISNIKKSQVTVMAEKIMDSEGVPIPLSVSEESFDITKYNFDQTIAPESHIVIRINDNRGIFIYSRSRQEEFFNRYLINKKAKLKRKS